MSLEQALQRAAEAAQHLERSLADAKAGYADVLRQVMQHSNDLGALRIEVRSNEEAAQKRHIELMEAIRRG